MSKTTGIEWTDATWNPWHGCHKVSAGCKNCYMFADKKRFGQDANVVVRSKTKFFEPLKWPEPRRVFTCSWSDWFIEEADEWRVDAWRAIRYTEHHTYQILTKRPERIAGHLPYGWPFPNVWLGVSVENRENLGRIDLLRKTPAAVRFLSLEPLLEDLGTLDLSGISWVIVGGESGPGARAMDPDWARSVRDQCVAAGVPFFFKQWGEWLPSGQDDARGRNQCTDADFLRVGKKRAGAMLDGQRRHGDGGGNRDEGKEATQRAPD